MVFVEGCSGGGVVGCLMVIHAIRGWTLAIIGLGVVARCGWLLRLLAEGLEVSA